MASRFEEDLCCPVCMEIFKNPVVQSCGHSFCMDCLKSCWRENTRKECPLCRTRSLTTNPFRNLTLKNLCDNFPLMTEEGALEQQQREELERRVSQLEKEKEELEDRMAFPMSLSHSSEQWERRTRDLEADLIEMRHQMEASQRKQSQLTQINLFLQNQVEFREASLKFNAEIDANMRSQLNQKIQRMERELTHLRTTQQESKNQRATTDIELERYRQLYREELRQNKDLVAELGRANRELREADSKLRNEPSRSLMTGSLGGPSLYTGSLAGPQHTAGPHWSNNRNLGQGHLLSLSAETEPRSSTLKCYRAQLDRAITEESRKSRTEEDAASASILQVSCPSMDPVIRTQQEYVQALYRRYKI